MPCVLRGAFLAPFKLSFKRSDRATDRWRVEDGRRLRRRDPLITGAAGAGGGRRVGQGSGRAVKINYVCADSFGESTPNKHHNGKDKRIRDEMFLESKHVIEGTLRFEV